MIRTLKLAVLWLARAAGLFRFARWATRGGFVIVGWHGVSMADEHSRLPSYFVTPEQLEQRIAHLRRYFRIVPLGELVAQHRAGKIQPRQAALTFDDGMRSFRLAAMPVLKRFDAPATVYALSDTVQQPRQSVPLTIRDLCLQSPVEELAVDDGASKSTMPMTSHEERHDVADRLVDAYEHRNGSSAAASKFLTNLADDLRVDLEPIRAAQTWDYMTGDELVQISREGVDVQAHSHSHLHCVESVPAVYEDTRKCKQLLEETTGREVLHYCYPSGYWTKDVWPKLAKAGMASAVTCNTGPNYAQTPPLALRRFIDNHCVTQLEFEFAVSGLRWLIHRCTHPFRDQVPNEKPTASGSYF